MAAGLVLLFASPRSAAAQAADPKAAFVQGLGRFSAALERQSVDESDLRAALDSLSRGLDQWDATLRSSESQFASSLPGSSSTVAARLHVALGAAYLDRSRLQDALREFDAGSHLDPSREEVFAFQGVAYDQALRDFDRAAAYYRQAAALDPLNATRAYLLARALDKAGKRDEALQAYQAVLRLWRKDVSEHSPIAIDTPFIQLALVQERAGVEPFFPPVRYAEGFALLRRGEYAKGLEAFQRAVEARETGRGERAYLSSAEALVEQRRFTDAEAAFRDAIAAFPASGAAHYRLGRLYHRQNKTLEALVEYEAAAKLAPFIGAGRVLQLIGALNAAEQHFDAAFEAYSTRVDANLNDPDAHRTLGYLYSRLERRDEALAEFAIALTIAPNSPDVLVAMSQLSLKDGDYAAAASAARQAIQLNPSNKQARYSLGTALMRLDKPDEAKSEFDAFERLQAEDTAAASRQLTINGLRREAAASMDKHEYERAVTALRQALLLSPGAFEVHEQLAAAYAALGQRENSERESAASRQLRAEALAREADR